MRIKAILWMKADMDSNEDILAPGHIVSSNVNIMDWPAVPYCCMGLSRTVYYSTVTIVKS